MLRAPLLHAKGQKNPAPERQSKARTSRLPRGMGGRGGTKETTRGSHPGGPVYFPLLLGILLASAGRCPHYPHISHVILVLRGRHLPGHHAITGHDPSVVLLALALHTSLLPLVRPRVHYAVGQVIDDAVTIQLALLADNHTVPVPVPLHMNAATNFHIDGHHDFFSNPPSLVFGLLIRWACKVSSSVSDQ